MRKLKIVIIHRLTPKTNYSRLLYHGFQETKLPIDIILYGNKKENLSDLPNARNVWTSALFPFQVFKQYLRDNPNIIHIQYEFTTFGPFWTNLLFPMLLLLTKIVNKKIVITVHSVIPKEVVDKELIQQLLPTLTKLLIGELLFKMFLVFLYRTMILFADELVVHGNWYKKSLVFSYKAIPDKAHVIPYGVNSPAFPNASLQRKWEKRLGEHKIILFFGNITPRKDIGTLIQSFAVFLNSHANYVLIIAGNESAYYRGYTERLKSLSTSLGVSKNVLFTGFIDDDEIHVLYSMSEFIVFPYLYGFEGPSGPLAFAIQHYVPIIGTNVGHLSEEICDMTEGLLVPPKNVNMLAEAMDKLANDDYLKDSFSKNLKIKINGMLWKDVALKTSRIYTKLATDEQK